MSKPKVFVIGASGNSGKPTIYALSKHYGDKLDIVAGVRKPENVREFEALKGVTVVRAEMGKRDELVGIFKDVQVLFIIAPRSLARAEIARLTAEAAKEAGVKHILAVSTGVAVGPDKIIGKQFHDIECMLANLGPDYTILRLPYFMENFGYFKETVQKSSAIYDSMDPTKRIPIISMDDVGHAAAVIMSSPKKHAGKTYMMVSDRRTYNDIQKLFSQALGKDVKYVQQSYDEAKATLLQLGLPEWNAIGALEFVKEVNDGEYEEGNDDDFTTITGEKPKSIEAWFEQNACMFK